MNPLIATVMLSVLSVSAEAQGVRPPPKLEDSPTLAAAAATRSLTEWIRFRPNLMRELFRGDPAQVLQNLKESKEYMQHYKTHELHVYHLMAKSIEQEIRTIQAAGAVDWKRFLDDRQANVGKELQAARSQELGLEKEIEALGASGDAETRRFRDMLEAQLTATRKLKEQLSNRRSDFESAALRDPSEARTDTLRRLEQQHGDLQRLRKIGEESRDSLNDFYDSVSVEVRMHAERQQAALARSRETAPAATRQPPGASLPKSVATVPAAPGKRRVWRFEQRKNFYEEKPRLVHLIVTEQGSIAKVEFKAWFQEATNVPANVEFTVEGKLDSDRFSQSWEAPGFEKGVLWLSFQSDNGRLPAQMTLSIEGTRKGGAVRPWVLQDLKIRELQAKAPPADAKAAEPKQPHRKKGN